ncbi:hypothetical protein [Streptomyces sp. NPDC096153]|uniref:hypothetical protein n=1 Tax=Streptomyces sp. NPDC096153 TaxID=3155548 RepID=UPI0033263241
MPYVIASIAAALYVEVAFVAALAVRTLAPEKPVTAHGPRYRGVHTSAAHLYRLAAESGRTI